MRIIDEVQGSTCFSSIALISGFLQLDLLEDDIYLTAFRDKDGKLQE